MTAVSLPGLDAGSPACVLALYGLVHVLGEGTKVRWTSARATWLPEVAGPGLDSLETVIDRLVDGIRADDLTSIAKVAKDVNEVTPQGWRLGVDDESTSIARLLMGLCAESPRRQSGERVALTPACVYSFGTRGTLFAQAAKQDAELDPADLARLLNGTWEARRGVNTLGLDPAARRQDGATMGADPSADGVRGVPGLVPLMLRGMATVAPMPGRHAVAGGAFVRDADGIELRWPVFDVWVSRERLALVAARDWTARTPAERSAARVQAVFGSRILRRERRVAQGRRVA